MSLIVFVSFIASYFYQRVFKPILRYWTGKHEIERALDSGNFFLILNTIMNSRFLNDKQKKEFRSLIIDVDHFENSNRTILRKLKELSLIYLKGKGLNNKTKSNLFRFMIIIDIAINSTRNNILKRTSIDFDPNDNQHVLLLRKLWKLTYLRFNNNTEEAEDIGLNSEKWLLIGFQGKCPATDFRSTGILGLEQLVNFCDNSKFFKEVYITSTNELKWYFFAAAGINITGKIRNFFFENPLLALNLFCSVMQKDHLSKINSISLALDDEDESNSDDYQQLMQRVQEECNIIFNEVYALAFHSFNCEWEKQKQFSFMNFNTLFENFSKRRIIPIFQEVCSKQCESDRKRFY